jgi:hypothetical protein
MAVQLVLSNDQYQIQNDAIKALYVPRNGTYELDIDANTVKVHPTIDALLKPLDEALIIAKQDIDKADNKNTVLNERLATLIKGSNANTIEHTIDDYLSEFATDSGQNDIIKRLMLPVVSTMNEHEDVLPDTVKADIIREMDKIRKLSPVLFPIKEDPSITVKTLKGTVTPEGSDTITKVKEPIDYEHYQGNLAEIDYDDFMTTYFNANNDTNKV